MFPGRLFHRWSSRSCDGPARRLPGPLPGLEGRSRCRPRLGSAERSPRRAAGQGRGGPARTDSVDAPPAGRARRAGPWSPPVPDGMTGQSARRLGSVRTAAGLPVAQPRGGGACRFRRSRLVGTYRRRRDGAGAPRRAPAPTTDGGQPRSPSAALTAVGVRSLPGWSVRQLRRPGGHGRGIPATSGRPPRRRCIRTRCSGPDVEASPRGITPRHGHRPPRGQEPYRRILDGGAPGHARDRRCHPVMPRRRASPRACAITASCASVAFDAGPRAHSSSR